MGNLKANPNSHLTAKVRETLSFPAKIVLNNHLLVGDVLDFATFSEMDRYKKDTGPYPWKEKDSLKIWAKLLKTIGATGSTGDPATQIEFLVKNSSAKGGAR